MRSDSVAEDHTCTVGSCPHCPVAMVTPSGDTATEVTSSAGGEWGRGLVLSLKLHRCLA